ncbi:alpha-methylacyl-CoA racemase [Streptomyces brevispora]|uniref:Alpha-methylacyl-CoA racemase n=1 Tax=Streptomyces brevispora TaxID=887462 RepID=A0A561UU99_9ACTN|nr:CaiB/BaiF CoA-transferase family protein [Streptomyces brevispora]TWG02941.1 alpha-methylacyl-CoA racemase [Streptomyces brevispora]
MGRGTGPLAGIRVVVVEGMGPTPYASMLLADMGAHVVRVARPATRPARALAQTQNMDPAHDIANRGVDTVELDLKSDQGRAAVLDLVAQADVFVEGFRPGVTERLGLGPGELLRHRPRLVYARLTGYGQSGPLSHTAGHDINYVAQSGVLQALSREGGSPMPPINLLGDYAGGGTFAAFGIVCAVLEAKSSGNGQVIDAAMVDGVAALTARIQGLRAAGTYSDEAGTNYLDGGAPFYDTYPCADGKYLAVGALESDFYAEFLKHLGVDTDDWPGQQDRAQWPRLRGLIAGVIRTRSRDAWAETYCGTDACVTPVLDFDEAAVHPHNAYRGLYKELGDVLHPAPAPRFSRTPAREPAAPTGERTGVTQLIEAWRDDAPAADRKDIP